MATLRNIPTSMSAATVAQIDARLESVKGEYDVAIPLAIESGSRAWGFPSPDSDYDCRFVFVRPANKYLSLFPERDVIETPLEGDLDVNGWDLAKALKLLLKGNAVIIEWLTSPVIYAADSQFRSEFLDLARQVVDRELVSRHYLHLGERQRRTYFRDEKLVALKKIFYALRPAAALRWLRFHPNEAIAPMHFPTLIAECDAPEAVRNLTDEMIAQKSVTRELGSGLLPSPIANFIDAEFKMALNNFDDGPRPIANAAIEQADSFLRSVVLRMG